MHPESDQAFTIGINDPKKDWFFAHVDRFPSVFMFSITIFMKWKVHICFDKNIIFLGE